MPSLIRQKDGSVRWDYDLEPEVTDEPDPKGKSKTATKKES